MGIESVWDKFLSEEDLPFGERIASAYKAGGNFADWDDVERRVEGFKRTMMTDRTEANFSFTPVRYSHMA